MQYFSVTSISPHAFTTLTTAWNQSVANDATLFATGGVKEEPESTKRREIITQWTYRVLYFLHIHHIKPVWKNETDQTVGEREGMFGQSLQHIWMALFFLIGKPGTPHVLMQRENQRKI